MKDNCPLLLALVLGCALALGCAGDDQADEDAGPDGGTATPEEIDLEWESLPPIDPHREQRDQFDVVWLSGTPYEMGVQHGELLLEELEAGLTGSDYVQQLLELLPTARTLGFVELAESMSYPSIVEECEGMADAAGGIGWTYELCLMVNFGDVLVEKLELFTKGGSRAPAGPGCSQFVVAGEATADGALYHGRLLDWSYVDFLLDYPVIFVRRPDEGVPHVIVGFPGNLSPYSGINAAGISGASNEADPLSIMVTDSEGHSHVQMLGRILASAEDLSGAMDFLLAEDHMSVEALGLADGLGGAGAALEMSADHVGVREAASGAVWLTNHFVAPATEGDDAEPVPPSSALRFDRLTQLLEPGGEDSVHGQIDLQGAAAILRDRENPYTGEEVPAGTFDNDGSLATNGAIYAIVFEPAALRFWVAAGATPVPEQPLVGFSVAELLGATDFPPVEPAIIE